MREFAVRYGRAAVEMSVTVRTEGDSFPARAANIGMGGLFVATERPVPVGAHVGLDLTLPDQSHAISLDGEVRWIFEKDGQPAGMGLRFVNPPVNATVAIFALLKEMEDSARGSS
jgi:uncharacterized protein (TIGR02266 family)